MKEITDYKEKCLEALSPKNPDGSDKANINQEFNALVRKAYLGADKLEMNFNSEDNPKGKATIVKSFKTLNDSIPENVENGNEIRQLGSNVVTALNNMK